MRETAFNLLHAKTGIYRSAETCVIYGRQSLLLVPFLIFPHFNLLFYIIRTPTDIHNIKDTKYFLLISGTKSLNSLKKMLTATFLFASAEICNEINLRHSKLILESSGNGIQSIGGTTIKSQVYRMQEVCASLPSMLPTHVATSYFLTFSSIPHPFQIPCGFPQQTKTPEVMPAPS